MWNLKTLTGALSALALAILLISPISAAADQGNTTLPTVTPAGHDLRSKVAGATPVKSKVSGSRTKIKIGGNDSDRKNLKAGMTCDITYKTDGKKNEPSILDCK